MRLRSAACAAVVLAVAAVAQAPAQAAPLLPVSPARPTAVASRVRSTQPAELGRTYTLVTGERVHLVGPSGHERVVVDPHHGRAAGAALAVRRLGQHLYVYPVALEPLLGRSVDLALFDLHAAQADGRGRIAVRLSYSKGRPVVPGVHVSSAQGGVARGYVTPRSAAAFGAALRKQAATAGTGGALFDGVDKISSVRDSTPPATARFPMKTLVIKVLGQDGKPQRGGLLALLNVDDGLKYGAIVLVDRGEARVSVPTGTYSAFSDDFVEGKTEDTGTLSITTVNEYVVTGAGQTLTIDHRTATVRPSIGTPRPAESAGLVLECDRVDATESAGVGFGGFVTPGIDLRLAPSAPARVGSLSLVESWTLAERGAKVPAYVYSVASVDDHIPAQARRTFRAQDLATVKSIYDGEGSGTRGGFSRAAEFPDSDAGGIITPVARGTRRTEYAGAVGAPAQWSDTMLVNYDSDEDSGFFDRDARSLPAGSTTSQEWFRGPLGAGIPVQGDQGFCFGCRSGNTLSLGLVPVTDSNPLHFGGLAAAGDELPVARFRLYRGSRLVTDEDDATGAEVKVTKKKKTYRAVLDVDRRETGARLSTQSQTELTFSSARNKGAKLPDDWFCDGRTCRVLPLLQARASLATNLQGQLSLGRSTVTVVVAQVEKAKKSPVTSAGLEYRPAGGDWVRVDLRRDSEGVYRGVIDDRDDPGTVADLRVSATDKAGSAYRQTVARAFSVAAK